MTPFAGIAAFALAQSGPALQAADDIRTLALRGADSSLVTIARHSPDDTREALRQLLAQAARDSLSDALPSARRLAAAYAIAWADSFFVQRVERFARMTAAQRIAKARGDSLRLAGNSALERLGVDAAMRRWRDSHRTFERIGDTAGIAAALGNLGVGFLRRDALDSAEAYLDRSRRLAQSIGDQRTTANATGLLGSVARARGELRQARAFFADATLLRARTGDNRGIAADHNELGLIDQDLGDLRAARQAFESALALNTAAGRNAQVATNLINIGNLLSLQSDYTGALAHYERALALYRRDRGEPDVAFALHSIGALAVRRGDYRAAIRSLSEAAGIYARTGPAVDEIAARLDLLNARAAIGDLRGARTELRRSEALAAAEPTDESMDTRARLALARGDLELHFNRLADAEREYARAIALTRGMSDISTRSAAQQGVGMVLLARESYARAQAALESALRAQDAAGDSRAAALTRLLFAYAARRGGDTALARRALRRAADTLAALNDAVGHAAALGALGDLELQNGLRLTAESLYNRGLALLRDRVAPDVAWQLHAGVARSAADRGDLDEASEALRRAIREIERVAGTLSLEERRAEFLADKWDAYVELAMVERARGRAQAAFEASERLRARQMLDLLARGRVDIAVASDLAGQEQDTRRRITELTRQLALTAPDPAGLRGRALTGDERGAALEALAQAQQAYTDLLARMRERQPAYASVVHGEIATLSDVQRALSPDDLLLEYLVGDSTLVVFAVTRDSVMAVDLNISHEALAGLIDFARAALSLPKPGAERTGWRAPMRRLYGHLIAPLDERGVLSGKRRLLIAPHAELHYLPFAALSRGDSADDLLLHRFVIEYVPSASVWLRLRERAAPARGSALLALAPRTDRLPGSSAEVRAIGTQYGARARVLVGSEATERAFRTLAPTHDVIHFATFGVLNKHNPLFSFIELQANAGDDGRLETHEIFGLQLKASLIVLSACQTGVGAGSVSDVPPGDDWVGLVRTFLFAGASNVVATLWPIDDRSTAVLMATFHRSYAQSRSPGEALREAQRAVARHPRTSHPFYWAAFVAVTGQ